MKYNNEATYRRGDVSTKKRIVLALLVMMSALLVSSAAFAQCSTDMECKGDRICVAGECVSPQPAASAAEAQVVSNPPPAYYPDTYQNTQNTAYQTNPYQLQQPQLAYRRPLSRGWAIPGGALGIVFSGLTLGFGLKSEIESCDNNGDAAIAWGAAATGILAVWTPVVFAAGKSARRSGDPRVRGVAGLRVTGWVTYGVTLASAVVLLGLGLADVTVPDGYILLPTIMGTASILCMSIDAFVSGAQASRAIRQDAAANQHAELNLRPKKEILWTVAASPVVSANKKISGAAVGVMGMF